MRTRLPTFACITVSPESAFIHQPWLVVKVMGSSVVGADASTPAKVIAVVAAVSPNDVEPPTMSNPGRQHRCCAAHATLCRSTTCFPSNFCYSSLSIQVDKAVVTKKPMMRCCSCCAWFRDTDASKEQSNSTPGSLLQTAVKSYSPGPVLHLTLCQACDCGLALHSHRRRGSKMCQGSLDVAAYPRRPCLNKAWHRVTT